MSTGSLRGKLLLVVGRKNVGKTTLIEKLLRELTKRGYRLGSIKYTTGDHEFDTPGKDSYRHSQAGAETTMIISPHRAAIFAKSLGERQLEEVLDFLFQGYDLVLGEGFRNSPYPKIEVHNPADNPLPLCSKEDNLIALVSSGKVEIGVPCFAPEQFTPLVEFIEENFLKRGRKR
jgi:molybdopterin-guanine dinucleotide biosynthesis protein B